jgi:hypothetical protein
MASDDDVDMDEGPASSAAHSAIATASDLGPRSIIVDQVTPPPYIRFSDYILQIIQEHFGAVAHLIAEQLLRQADRLTLRQIVIGVRQASNNANTVDQIKAALKALLQHSVVSAKPIASSENGEFNYFLNHDEVQGLVRFAKYVMLLQRKDGVWFDSGTVIECFADKGKLTKQAVIDFAVQKEVALGGAGGEDSETRISQAFKELAHHGFIVQCDLSKFVEQFNEVETSSKKSPVQEIWWVNHDRFILEFRNNFIQDYVTSKHDATASKVVRVMIDHRPGVPVKLDHFQGGCCLNISVKSNCSF